MSLMLTDGMGPSLTLELISPTEVLTESLASRTELCLPYDFSGVDWGTPAKIVVTNSSLFPSFSAVTGSRLVEGVAAA